MKSILLLAAISLIGTALSAPRHDDKLWLMFFMRGEAKGPTEEKAQQEAMKGHLGNMKKQAALGRLLAAGPMQDPSGQRRGITVLLGHDENELKSYFTQDPFVKAGVMTVSAWQWKVDAKKFNPKVDETGIAEHRIVFIRRGKGMQPQTAQMAREHEHVLSAVAKKFGPGVWGPITGMDKVHEVLIVSGKDTAGIQEMFKADPLVSKAILELEIIPLWMSKGVIKG